MVLVQPQFRKAECHGEGSPDGAAEYGASVGMKTGWKIDGHDWSSSFIDVVDRVAIALCDIGGQAGSEQCIKLIGPLGAVVPFPAKLRIRVLDPVVLDVLPDQPRYSRSRIMDTSEDIRHAIQAELYDMLRHRRSVWFG